MKADAGFQHNHYRLLYTMQFRKLAMDPIIGLQILRVKSLKCEINHLLPIGRAKRFTSYHLKMEIGSRKVIARLITKCKSSQKKILNNWEAEKYEITVKRSRPSAPRDGTARAKFWGSHWGYTCQSRNELTPGQSFSVGVPSNLQLVVQQ